MHELALTFSELHDSPFVFYRLAGLESAGLSFTLLIVDVHCNHEALLVLKRNERDLGLAALLDVSIILQVFKNLVVDFSHFVVIFASNSSATSLELLDHNTVVISKRNVRNPNLIDVIKWVVLFLFNNFDSLLLVFFLLIFFLGQIWLGFIAGFILQFCKLAVELGDEFLLQVLLERLCFR